MSFLQKLLIKNLKFIFNYIKITNQKDAAKYIGINYSTFRSWMSYERLPSLVTLDRICDIFKIPTYVLFLPDLSDFNLTKINVTTNNNSIKNLNKNLKILYKKKGKDNWNDIESIYSGLLSRETLKSYHRGKNYITPPISTLDKMCSYLGIPAYKLLRGEKDAI